MKRSLVFLALVASLAPFAVAQTSTVTSASGGLKINGRPVNGNVTISAQVPVAVAGGGLMLSSAKSGYVTQCSVSSGAITGSCAVPSSTLSNGGNGVLYSVLVTDSFAGNAQLLTNVSISGASWALDQYVPPSTVSTVAAFTYTTGSGAPGGGCSSTSLYGDTSGSTINFYGCKAGSWVAIGGGGGPDFNGGAVTNPIIAPSITLGADPSSNLQAATKQYVDNHTPNLTAPGPIGGTTPAPGNFTNVTAQSVATNGSGPSGLTVTPNGTTPTAPSNSIVYGVPLSVPTPYVFLPPTNVTSATSQTPMQCTYSAGPPKVLTCALAAITGGSGLNNGLSTGVNSGNFSCLSWYGGCTNGAYTGLLADITGADKRLFLDTPSGGGFMFRVGGTGIFQIPSTTPSSSGQYLKCTFSSGISCVWDNGSGSGGLGNGLSTGVNSGAFSVLSWNGNYANSTYAGILADTSGTDKRMWWNVPATGYHELQIGGQTTFEDIITSGVYGGVTFNGNQTAAGYAGLVADGTGSDPSLYYNVPTGGSHVFKVNNANVASFSANGMHLNSGASATCNSSTGPGGLFNYQAGASGVKDTVQVCAKDASNTYAWRTIY